MYIQIKENKLIEISCGEEYAEKNNLIKVEDDFKYSSHFPFDTKGYHENLIAKTETELIDEGLLVDNRGDYYSTDTGEKITITDFNKEVPGNTTKLIPPLNYPKWDIDKWTQDIELAKTEKINQLGKSISAKFNQGFEYDNKIFGCTMDDITYWNKIEAKLDRYEFPLENKIKNIAGEYYKVSTREIAIKLLDAGESYVDDLRKEYSDKSIVINGFTTIEEIENYNVG